MTDTEGPPDDRQVIATLEGYLRAEASGDGKRACALLTRKARRMQGEALGPYSSCVSGISSIARLVPPDSGMIEVKTVRLIVGRRAEAIAELPRETDKVFFKKVGDAWEIDAFNELSSRK